jgi:hypothetical protein
MIGSRLTLAPTNLAAATADQVAKRRSKILATSAAIIDRGSFFKQAVQRTAIFKGGNQNHNQK